MLIIWASFYLDHRSPYRYQSDSVIMIVNIFFSSSWIMIINIFFMFARILRETSFSGFQTSDIWVDDQAPCRLSHTRQNSTYV